MQTSLYRAYDAADALLYVGISFTWLRRLKQHQSGSAWFSDVRKVCVQHFATRREAEMAERAAIVAEHPRHNTTHRARPKRQVRQSGPSDGWYVDNAVPYLRAMSDGRASPEALPAWLALAHYILAYPERLARFTALWIEGAIPDGHMSAQDLVDEMNKLDGPKIKSSSSYSNWKAKGFPGFTEPEYEVLTDARHERSRYSGKHS